MEFIVAPLVGLLLLVTGYRYYWLIAGGIGFLFGINIVSTSNSGDLTTAAIGIGLMFGLLGAIAARFVTTLALGFISFFIGGMLLVGLFNALAWESGSSLVLFLVGGGVGLLAMRYAQDYALIFLSSVIGATILISAVPQLEPEVANLGFLFLTGAGFVVQSLLRTKWK